MNSLKRKPPWQEDPDPRPTKSRAIKDRDPPTSDEEIAVTPKGPVSKEVKPNKRRRIRSDASTDSGSKTSGAQQEDILPPLTTPIRHGTHSRPTQRTHFPGFLRHRAQLPTCPTSPKATRTHPIQSSDICGRVARPATNQPDFLTPVDVAPAVHPDDPSTGPSAQPRRHPVHSHSRPANCHTSAPPVRHHSAGSLAPCWLLPWLPLASPHLILYSTATGRCRSRI